MKPVLLRLARPGARRSSRARQGLRVPIRRGTSYWDRTDSKRLQAEVEHESLRDTQMRLWGWCDMRQRDYFRTHRNGWAGDPINPPLERRPYRDEPLPVVPHTTGEPSPQFFSRRVYACIGISDDRRPCRGCACGYVAPQPVPLVRSARLRDGSDVSVISSPEADSTLENLARGRK